MKPILPKRSGAPRMQGIFTSPRTTIILAPTAAAPTAVPLGNSLSSSLILPAPPTFTITLASHQVPQPTPVILPLTKTTASSSSFQLQCAPIAPKTSHSVIDLKDQQSSSIYIKGKGLKDSHWKSKGKGDGRRNQKCSSFETPILPKKPQPEPQTVILLPSTPEGKTSELPPPVLVPECSLVITGDAYPQTTVKEKRISKTIKSVKGEEKFNKFKDIHQEKSLQNKLEPSKRYRNQTKTARLKLRKKKNVDNQGSVVDETCTFVPSYADGKGAREASSFLARESVSSTYLSESLSLSTEGSLHQSGHLPHQQDVPYHPPPPYPQDSVAKRVSSIAYHTKANKGILASKAQKDTPDLSTNGLRLLHIQRKKCEWKNKRHSIAEGLSNESASVSLPKVRSDSSSNCNSSDMSNNHMPLYLPSSSSNVQPFPTTSATSSLSANVTVGKISLSNIAEASYLSSVVQSHSPQNKNRNIPPSLCESHTNHKGPPHHEHYSFPTSSSTTLEAQTSIITPVKSSQEKSCEYSYLLQPDSPGICVSGVSPTSLSSGSSSTQSSSHTSYCSPAPAVTHLPQSSVCSLSSLYSDAHETSSTVPPSSGILSCEPKSVVGTVLPQSSLHLNQNTQHTHTSFSPHLDVGDQTEGSTFYSQSPQCSSSLPSLLHSHLPNTSTETSFINSSQFLSCMSSRNQTIEQKVSSHSSSYSDSPQQNPYPLQPTSYVESPQLTSFKPPQASFINSPQLPSYTQSSRASSYSRSTDTALTAMSHHLSSCVHPVPSAVRSQCIHTQCIKGPHSNQNLTSEQHASCLQPTQSLPLCSESQRKVDPGHSSRGASFSSGYTPSFHPSPHAQPQTQPSQMPSVTVENVSTVAMCKDNSQSPIPPPYAVSGIVLSSSQYYSDSPSMSYTSEKASTANDSHYFSLGKLKSSSSSSSPGVNSSHIILERSLSPPSYEAHLQSSASYIASSGSAQISQDNLQHSQHHTSTNYSFSSQIVHGQRTQSLHEDVKKTINSNCSPSPSPLLSLPPPPRYNYRQELTSEDQHIDQSLIADIAQGTYNYDTEESSETYFPSTATDTPLPLPSESQPHSQPPNSIEYRASNTHINIHVASQGMQDSNGVQPRQQSSQSRLLIYSLGKQGAPCKNIDQDDIVFSNWSTLTQSTEHSDNLRVEKLWFIPHQEQNHAYMKESAKYFSNGQGLQSTKDLMLKKFWIEEDEPIAEEIISSLPCRPQQQERVVEDQEEKATLPQSLSPHYPASKKNKTRQMLCQICGKMLKGHKSLRSHLNSHYNIQPHSCPTCAKKFTNRSVLVEHLRIHSGETPYLCSLCSAAFRTRSGLLKHGSMHSSARPFECSMCSKKFKTKLVLQQHMKLHLTGIFTCSECGKTFERHRSLAVHKAFHHHKSQRFRCPHCPKGYHFRSLLNQHMQLHSSVQKHICTVCGKSFVWRSGLVAHLKTHSLSRPKCDICDKCFASEKRLESHYQRHTNQKPHQCKVCGRNFSHAYRLASHSVIHEEHKEYRCCTCDIVFTNAKKFRKHLVTHKSEEPKICRLSGTVEVPKSAL